MKLIFKLIHKIWSANYLRIISQLLYSYKIEDTFRLKKLPENYDILLNDILKNTHTGPMPKNEIWINKNDFDYNYEYSATVGSKIIFNVRPKIKYTPLDNKNESTAFVSANTEFELKEGEVLFRKKRNIEYSLYFSLFALLSSFYSFYIDYKDRQIAQMPIWSTNVQENLIRFSAPNNKFNIQASQIRFYFDNDFQTLSILNSNSEFSFAEIEENILKIIRARYKPKKSHFQIAEFPVPFIIATNYTYKGESMQIGSLHHLWIQAVIQEDELQPVSAKVLGSTFIKHTQPGQNAVKESFNAFMAYKSLERFL